MIYDWCDDIQPGENIFDLSLIGRGRLACSPWIVHHIIAFVVQNKLICDSDYDFGNGLLIWLQRLAIFASFPKEFQAWVRHISPLRDFLIQVMETWLRNVEIYGFEVAANEWPVGLLSPVIYA